MVVGEKVYVGGRSRYIKYRDENDSDDDAYDHVVYQYNRSKDKWNMLSFSPAEFVTLANFRGRLIAVGGFTIEGPTGKVHTYAEAVNCWEELIPPMPTPRYNPSVATTATVIIAAGGLIGSYHDCCATVEVYSMASSQWHTADPLPKPCYFMNSVIIDNTCYFLCGYTIDFFCASVNSLMEKIARPPPKSVWKCLPHTPLASSAAVSLRGTLIIVRALDGVTAVHAFLDKAWVRHRGADLQEKLSGYFAASLSPDTVIVFGSTGQDGNDPHAVYIGTIGDP